MAHGFRAYEDGMTRRKFITDLKCPNCGQLGGAVWEENDTSHKDGPQSQLLALNGDFHKEQGRAVFGGPIIVCTKCDEIHPDI